MWENIKYWFKQHDYQWRYKLVVCLPLFVFLVLADIIPKIVIQLKYTQGDTFGDQNGFLSFHYVINLGSAEGGMANNLGATIAIACVITLIALCIFLLVNDKMWLIAFVFVIAGSVANLLARSWAPAVTVSDDTSLIGKRGGVIDFINTNIGKWGFINNIADIEVSVFVILIVVFAIVELVKYFVRTNNGSVRPVKDNEVFDTTQPRVDEVREEYDEPVALTKKELKAKKKLEKMKKNEH